MGTKITIVIEAVNHGRVSLEMDGADPRIAYMAFLDILASYRDSTLLTIRVEGGEGNMCARAGWLVGQFICKGAARTYAALSGMGV